MARKRSISRHDDSLDRSWTRNGITIGVGYLDSGAMPALFKELLPDGTVQVLTHFPGITRARQFIAAFDEFVGEGEEVIDDGT